MKQGKLTEIINEALTLEENKPLKEEFEIYFSDLNDEAKQQLLDYVGVEDASEMNWDIDMAPIAIFESLKLNETKLNEGGWLVNKNTKAFNMTFTVFWDGETGKDNKIRSVSNEEIDEVYSWIEDTINSTDSDKNIQLTVPPSGHSITPAPLNPNSIHWPKDEALTEARNPENNARCQIKQNWPKTKGSSNQKNK